MSSSPAQTPSRRPSLLGGSMIIAGTAVGAGMFSCPSPCPASGSAGRWRCSCSPGSACCCRG
ncbi:hypothetical protein KGZ78_17085 [Pseudomonas aeruginosa]|nr:hypothetical protein [Pseudomonas aeruginosa]QVJ03855.1 hypothetical protein KGZ78_17085 [Pseudomonas aeruginosa]